MNGYFGWWKNHWTGEVKNYAPDTDNCSRFASELWFRYTGATLDSGEWLNTINDFGVHTPGILYNAIGGYNWDGQSQCYTGSLQY